MSCQHISLRFGDGGRTIQCDLCDVEWRAVLSNGMFDFDRARANLSSKDHRVKPMESSSKNPKVVLPKSEVDTKGTTRILRPDPGQEGKI